MQKGETLPFKTCSKWSVEILFFLKVLNKSCYSTASNNFRGILQKQLEDIKAAGTYKTERIITSPQESNISVEGSPKKVLNFCANNYLGLSANEDIKNYAKKMLDEYGSEKKPIMNVVQLVSETNKFQVVYRLCDLFVELKQFTRN